MQPVLFIRILFAMAMFVVGIAVGSYTLSTDWGRVTKRFISSALQPKEQHRSELPEFPGALFESESPSLDSPFGAFTQPATARDANLEPVAPFGGADVSRYRAVSRAIGRVDFRLRIDGRDVLVPCTGFLVSFDVVMTAHHCVEAAGSTEKPEVSAARFWLGYDADDNPEAQVFPLSIDYVESYPAVGGVEYILLRFKEQSAEQLKSLRAQPLRLLDTALTVGQDLFVIHHPLGQPGHVSRKSCRVVELQDAETVFSHSCGTLGGTSGAPIFDDKTGFVVGMHVRGKRSVADSDANIATGITSHALLERSAYLRSTPRNAQE